MSILSRLIQRAVGEVIEQTIPRLLDEKLPSAIDEVAISVFAARPDAELTEAGFTLALSLALRAHWPDVGRCEAASWLWDYIGAPFGTAGYDWTPRAAAAIAASYVGDFSEEPR